MEELSLLEVFFLFLCGHALGDFALQGDWVARYKDRHAHDTVTEDQAATAQVIWPWLMSAHALQHGLLVYLVSQNTTLGFLESIAHWITDFGKCEKWYGFHFDQFIHIGWKLVWIAALYYEWV